MASPAVCRRRSAAEAIAAPAATAASALAAPLARVDAPPPRFALASLSLRANPLRTVGLLTLLTALKVLAERATAVADSGEAAAAVDPLGRQPPSPASASGDGAAVAAPAPPLRLRALLLGATASATGRFANARRHAECAEALAALVGASPSLGALELSGAGEERVDVRRRARGRQRREPGEAPHRFARRCGDVSR